MFRICVSKLASATHAKKAYVSLHTNWIATIEKLTALNCTIQYKAQRKSDSMNLTGDNLTDFMIHADK